MQIRIPVASYRLQVPGYWQPATGNDIKNYAYRNSTTLAWYQQACMHDKWATSEQRVENALKKADRIPMAVRKFAKSTRVVLVFNVEDILFYLR